MTESDSSAKVNKREVGEYLKISQSQYSLYERGYRDIPTDLLIRLADLYHTTTDYILGRTDVDRQSEQ